MADHIPEEAKNFKLLGHDSSAAWGGGSIVEINKGFAYVGAVGSASYNGPEGFTVHDVRDPRKPKKVAEVKSPPGVHSHKLRVVDGDILYVNSERLGGEAGRNARTGLFIFDISKGGEPKQIGFYDTPGNGPHRFGIDNKRKLFCLDDSKSLALATVGEHIPLIDPNGPPTDLPFTKPILIAAANPALAVEPLKLRLDSGTNVAMLHRANPRVTKLVSTRTPTLHHVVEGIEQVFAILPKSDLAIGNHRLHDLSFVVPAKPARDIPPPREDGILPTCGFRSVFISPSGHYATVETW